MSTCIIPGDDWVMTYLAYDGPTYAHFLDSLNSLRPIHRKMKGITDPQRWLNEYSRIVHDTSNRRRKNEPTYFADVNEVREYLTTWLNEIEED